MRNIVVVGLMLLSTIMLGQSDTTYHENGKINEIVTVKSTMFKKTSHRFYDKEGELTETGNKIDGKKTGYWEEISMYFGAKMYHKRFFSNGIKKRDSTFKITDSGPVLFETYTIDNDGVKAGRLNCNGLSSDFDSSYTYVEKFYVPSGIRKNTYNLNSNEKLHGKFTQYYSSGKLKSIVFYVCGEKTGNYYSYYENGNEKIKTRLKDGNIDGHYSEYRENGSLKIKGYAQNGRSTGTWYKYDQNKNKKYKYKPQLNSNFIFSLDKIDDIYWSTYYKPAPKTTYTAPKKTYSKPKRSKRSALWDPYNYSGLSVTYSDSIGLWGVDMAANNWLFGVQARYIDNEEDGITHEVEIIKPYIGYTPKIYRSMFLQLGVGFNSYYESTYYGTNWNNPISKLDDIGYTAFGGVMFNMIGDGSVGFVVGAAVEYDQVLDGVNYMWKIGLSFD